MTTGQDEKGAPLSQSARRPRGVVREGLIAAGLEMARTGGPEAVVLREATRAVGVVPNAAYRHFANRDELLAAVAVAAMGELGARMAAAVAAVGGRRGSPSAARRRLRAIGTSYLDFAREEPGWFAAAYAVPEQHAYATAGHPDEPDLSPLGQLRDVLDELVEAGALDAQRRVGIEYAVWSAVHGTAVLAGQGPLRKMPADDLHRLAILTLDFIGDGMS